jgi:hypothetical protein
MEEVGGHNDGDYCSLLDSVPYPTERYQIGVEGWNFDLLREDILVVQPESSEHISRFVRRASTENILAARGESKPVVPMYNVRFEDAQGNIYDTEVRIVRRVPNISGRIDSADDEGFFDMLYEALSHGKELELRDYTKISS